MKLPKIPPGLPRKIVNYLPLSEPIRLQDLEDSARSQAWKKNKYTLLVFDGLAYNNIRANILRVAWYFSELRGDEEK